MVSVRREVIGKRVAKSTYSPFVMAIEVAFVRWLAREGGRKFRETTRLGLDQKSRQEKRGNQDQKKQRDQKERQYLGGDYLLDAFEGKEDVDGSCFGPHLVAVEED